MLKRKGSIFILKNEIDEEIDIPEEEEGEKPGCLAKAKARYDAYKEKKEELESEFF